jgi:hypothetical protein
MRERVNISKNAAGGLRCSNPKSEGRNPKEIRRPENRSLAGILKSVGNIVAFIGCQRPMGLTQRRKDAKTQRKDKLREVFPRFGNMFLALFNPRFRGTLFFCLCVFASLRFYVSFLVSPKLHCPANPANLTKKLEMSFRTSDFGLLSDFALRISDLFCLSPSNEKPLITS